MNEIGLAPLIRYNDVMLAIHWLSQTFGFKIIRVVEAQDRRIAYAEMSFGRGLLMIGPSNNSQFDEILKQPHNNHGFNIQCCYVCLNDIHTHYKNACEAGAEILEELRSDSNGEHAYIARDPEGHIWNFGTYSPWRTRRDQPKRDLKFFPNSKYSIHKISATLAISAIFAYVIASMFYFEKHQVTLQQSQSEIKTIGTEERYNDNLSQQAVLEDQKSSQPPESVKSSIVMMNILKDEMQNDSHSAHPNFIEKPTPEAFNVDGGERQLDLDGISSTTTGTNSHKLTNDHVNLIPSQLKEDPRLSLESSSSLSAKHDLENPTGSLGEQPRRNPKLDPTEPLPAVTVAPSVPQKLKPAKIKKSLEIKKTKPKLIPTNIFPVSTKKKPNPPTDISPYFMFD